MMNASDLIDRDTIVEGVARGVAQYLTQSGAGTIFGDLGQIIAGLHLLKEGLLTAQQAAHLLQISRRCFADKVAAGVFRRIETLGYSEPRFWAHEIIAAMPARDVSKAAGKDGAPAALNVVDLAGATAGTGKRRRQKAA